MENYNGTSAPLSIEHVDTILSEHLTEEYIEHLASASNLSYNKTFAPLSIEQTDVAVFNINVKLLNTHKISINPSKNVPD